MVEQQTLPLDEPYLRATERRFWRFHESNPQVYGELVRLARDLRARGHERYGIGGLFEVLRWHRAMRTEGEPFKLNNNYRAYYARLIGEKEPDLAGFFETRKSKADG